VDIRIAALVGMAAIFAGASRALLTAVVFSFETTGQMAVLLPLLGGCTAAYLVSALLMRNTIMTEKIARRGVRVPSEYAADYLDQVNVGTACARNVHSLRADQTLAEVRRWLGEGTPEAQHQGFPVVDGAGQLQGVLTRRSLLDPLKGGHVQLRELIQRPPVIVYDDLTLRDAADHMVNHDIGRLPVVSRKTGGLVGVITRSDVLKAHRQRLTDARRAARSIQLRVPWRDQGDAEADAARV
jgi:CBS domain-containing protein